MKRFTKSLIVVMLILAVGLFMTGCKVTGGGWFIDQRGNKCTLGFNAQGEEPENCREMFAAKGQFQFNDHAKPDGTKIHASVEGLFGTMVGSVGGYIFEGETKAEETVIVIVTDLGEPGVDAGDGIYVNFEGQEWYGVLGGGNIQGH
jgi:hypothetical protein